MGQEQSSPVAASSSPAPEGVHEVAGSGAALVPRTSGEDLLRAARALPLPAPVLATEAATGATNGDAAAGASSMLHELQTAVADLSALGLTTLGGPAALAESIRPRPTPDIPSRPAGPVPVAAVSRAKNAREEQALWARVGVDEGAAGDMLRQLDGGERAREAMRRQTGVSAAVVEADGTARELLEATSRARRECADVAVVADRLDRLAMDVADVQESLERSVATANILGAAHFAEDEVLCSFRNYLKANPPVVRYPTPGHE